MKWTSSKIWTAIIVVVACLIFVAIVVASVFVWQLMGDVALSRHGWIALIIGAIVTFALGAGLMALSFYSSKSGHDDTVSYDEDDKL